MPDLARSPSSSTAGASRPQTPVGRLSALDGMRGVAAVSVVLLHAWLYTTDQSGDLSSPSDAFMHELRLGLVLFFVLSGFLLWRPWLRADRASEPFGFRLRRYVLRRATRILPAYYLALLGAMAIVLLTGDDHHAPPPAQFPLFLVFGQNLSGETMGRLDPPMWTLAVEMSFYAAIPLLALATRRIRRPLARALLAPLGLLLAGTIYNVTISAHGVPSTTLVDELPAMAPDFACGMLAAAVIAGEPLSRARRTALALLGGLLVLGDGAWHTQVFQHAQLIVRDLPAAAGFACVLVALVRAPAGRPLAARPLAALGAVSYGLYLWHMPLIFLLRGADLWPPGLLPAAALLLLTTLPVAAASWRWVERPALRALASRSSGSPAYVAAKAREPAFGGAAARGG